MSAEPRISTAWRAMSWKRVLLIAGSIVDIPLDVAELDDGQRADQEHEDDGLRGRAAEVERLESVAVDLEDQCRRGAARSAAGGRVDDRERIAEGVDEIRDDQKEGRRHEQRQHNGTQAHEALRAVERGRLQ